MSLFSWFKKRRDKEIPADVCPNCWGKQEYGDEKIDLVRDHRKAVETGELQDAFVRAIQVRYVSDQDGKRSFYCARCQKGVYVEAPEN